MTERGYPAHRRPVAGVVVVDVTKLVLFAVKHWEWSRCCFVAAHRPYGEATFRSGRQVLAGETFSSFWRPTESTVHHHPTEPPGNDSATFHAKIEQAH